ncbi:myosin light chain kinase, smooth muscle-like isoform X3 [Gigantopelta aegis]|uniref:myosin light chain kinase, smooth muscle-like isoform X3 n=1 Tax=Gigantopelta aegis TaxID=1735272 RepID=UPI001B88E002|nr:myosin light chain kinase, smooth muscle-like isoform X3 [Gigantopelta aegis]
MVRPGYTGRDYGALDKLTVMGKPPRFSIMLPREIEAVEGGKLRLDCSVDGIPQPLVTWHKGVRELSYGERHRIIMCGTMHTMEIHSLMTIDQGEYIVRATNAFGTIETACFVKIKKRSEAKDQLESKVTAWDKPRAGPGRAPFFIKHLPRTIDVMAGTDVRLDCIIRGGIEVVKFTDDDVADAKSELEKEGFEGDFVTIPETKMEKASEDVKEKTETPQFVTKMADLILPAGSEAVFECVVAGQPAPVVTWEKDGKAISPNKNIQISMDGERHLLRIAMISTSDEGKYICTATSLAGTLSHSASLSIEAIVPEKADQTEVIPTPPPVFSQELSPEVTSTEGDNLVLTCFIKDAKSVHWEKDGVKLPKSQRLPVTCDSEGNQTLEFMELCDKDSGKYTCVAAMADGTEVATSTVVNVEASVKQMETETKIKPTFLQTLSDQRCRDGESVTMECEVHGDPRPQITWYKDGEEVLDSQDFQISMIGDVCKLQLTEVFPEDEGHYWCQAINSAGEVTTECQLTVEGGNRKTDTDDCLEFRIDLNNRKAPEIVAPEFVVKPRRQFVDEGQSAVFKMSFDGSPDTSVSWTMNGEPIENDSKHKIYEKDGFHYLEVDKVSESDKGKYECTVENSSGKASVSADLEVFVKTGPLDKKIPGPTLVQPLKDITVAEGDRNVVIDCRVSGATKDCSAAWFKDGKEIKPGREFRTKFDNRIASLTISETLEEDNGQYECVISGAFGELRTSGFITVEVSNELREPPVFVRELHDMEVDNGDKVELVVEVKGSQPVNVFWIHNNREILPQDSEYTQVADGDVRKLILSRVFEQDTGEYVCEAYNDYGDTDTFCRLQVRDVEIPFAPDFITKPKPLTISEGSHAMFSCQVRGHPVPVVSWEHNGQPVEEGSKYKCSSQGDEHVLEIFDVKEEDTGKYLCRLTNTCTMTSHSTSLVVTDVTGSDLRDFRALLKPRPVPEKPAKQIGSVCEKSDIETKTKDFHQLLSHRHSAQQLCPTEHEQHDFRNVLRTHSGKHEKPLVLGLHSGKHDKPSVLGLQTMGSRKKQLFQTETQSSPKCATEQTDFRSVLKKAKSVPYASSLPRGSNSAVTVGRPGVQHTSCEQKMSGSTVSDVKGSQMEKMKKVLSDPENKDTRRVEKVPEIEEKSNIGKSDLSPFSSKDEEVPIVKDKIQGEISSVKSTTMFPAKNENSLSSSIARTKETIPLKKRLEQFENDKPESRTFCTASLPKPGRIPINVKMKPGGVSINEKVKPGGVSIKEKLNKFQQISAENDSATAKNGSKTLLENSLASSRSVSKSISHLSSEEPTVKMMNTNGQMDDNLPRKSKLFDTKSLPRDGLKNRTFGSSRNNFTSAMAGVSSNRIQEKVNRPKLRESPNSSLVRDKPMRKAVSLLELFTPENKPNINSSFSNKLTKLAALEAKVPAKPKQLDFRNVLNKQNDSSVAKQPTQVWSKQNDSIAAKQSLSVLNKQKDSSVLQKSKVWNSQNDDTVAKQPEKFSSKQNGNTLVKQPAKISSKQNEDTFSKQPPNILSKQNEVSKQPPNILSKQNEVSKQPPNILSKQNEDTFPKQPPNILSKQNEVSKQPPNILSKQNEDTFSKQPPNILSKQNEVSKQPPNILSKQNSDAFSTQPPNILSKQNEDTFCKQPPNILSKQNVDAFSTQPPNILSKQNEDTFCKQPPNILGKQNVDAFSKQPPNILSKQNEDTFCKQPPNILGKQNGTAITQQSKDVLGEQNNNAVISQEPRTTVANQNDGTVQHSSTVLSKHDAVAKQPPSVKQKLCDQRVKYGSKAVLECVIIGDDVQWSLNGKDVTSPLVKMSYADNNVATLTIAEAYSEDEGEYTLTATNKFGSSSTTCRLSVDSSSSQSSKSDIEGHVTIPARIISLVTNSETVMNGDVLEMRVTTTGEPPPNVCWFKGKQEIKPDVRIELENDADTSILRISKVTANDAGKYIVVSENHAGLDRASQSVQVEDIPDPPIGKPQPTAVVRSAITLSWYGPAYDGGCQVTHYRIEGRRVGDDSWVVHQSNCKNTFYQIDDLEANTAYVFRVSAGNKHGYSCPGNESEEIVTENRLQSSSDYESDGTLEVFSPTVKKQDDELPFEPREVKISSTRVFEDHYEVLHEVGRGKFGNVYQCKAKDTGKLWAAKIVKCREKEKENVRHEIEIMNGLAHPKLLLLWDAYEAARKMVLVMEYIGGGELFERVSSNDFCLTERDCVHFMRQICSGVAYMHGKGVLHLDLKPENILCIAEGSNIIKIIDFGLARRFNEGESIKVMFGTPEFIAPEVVNYDEIDFATDMWSIGVICYVLLSGLSPFMGDNDSETLSNVTYGEYDFDDESFDDISDNAKDFIQHLLVKNKRKRSTIQDCQKHIWLVQDERRMRLKRLNTEKLRRFMARRKWQKTGTAIRALGRMASLQRLISASPSNNHSSSGSSSTDPNTSFSSTSSYSPGVQSQASVTANENTLSSPTPKVQEEEEEITEQTTESREATQRNVDQEADCSREVTGEEEGENVSTEQISRSREIMQRNDKQDPVFSWKTVNRRETTDEETFRSREVTGTNVEPVRDETVHQRETTGEGIHIFKAIPAVNVHLRETTLTSSSDLSTTEPSVDRIDPSVQKTNGHINNRFMPHVEASSHLRPNFVKKMVDCQAFKGDVVRFDIKVAGEPCPTVSWYHEDDVVVADERHIVEVGADGQCSLIIRRVGEEDDGEYTARAVSLSGDASCSAELIICGSGAF